MSDEKRLGVYVHIPFCGSRCAYCDFYSTVGGSGERMWRYAEVLKKHIIEYAPQLDGYLIDTVYFGGGTPSRFGASRLTFVLNELKKHGHVSLDAEITVEANPESVTLAEMRKLRRAGFNRVSLGVQSTKDKYLNDLGRMHNYAAAKQAFANIRKAGFKNVSVDIMYGLPHQTRDDFAEDLQNLIALQPDHISCYGLKLEESTAFGFYLESPMFMPSDDDQADMYLYAVDTMKRYGYTQYEVSNFAKKGYLSYHNVKYWLGGEYLGFGASAASYIGGTRFELLDDLDDYMDAIESGGGVIKEQDTIEGFELLGEYIMLRMRTTHGVSKDEYREIYNFEMGLVLEFLEAYKEKGWVRQRGDRWSFTPEGFLISTTLINGLLGALQRERTERVRPWQKETLTAGEQKTMLTDERPKIGKFI